MIERSDGTRMWYHHDKLHRADGPAVEYPSGDLEWYLNGMEYTFTEWLEHNQTLDSKTRILYMLEYGDGVMS